MAYTTETRLHIDPQPVTESMAATLCAHHLSLAAAYFEAAGEDLARLKREAENVMRDPAASMLTSCGLTAAITWLERMDALYRNLRDELGD